MLRMSKRSCERRKSRARRAEEQGKRETQRAERAIGYRVSRAAAVRRSERTRPSSASDDEQGGFPKRETQRAERAIGYRVSRAAAVRRSERTRPSSASDDEQGGFQSAKRSERSEQSDTASSASRGVGRDRGAPRGTETPLQTADPASHSGFRPSRAALVQHGLRAGVVRNRSNAPTRTAAWRSRWESTAERESGCPGPHVHAPSRAAQRLLECHRADGVRRPARAPRHLRWSHHHC